jgi:competence protein ComEA
MHSPQEHSNASREGASSDAPPVSPVVAVSSRRAPAVDSAQATRSFLVVAGGCFLTVMCVWYWNQAGHPPEPLPWERGTTFQSFRVEVNSATWAEWMQLEGIGQTMARRIVADRSLNGPFSDIDDLSRVPGIGPATLDRIRPWLTIRHAQPQLAPAHSHSTSDSLTDPAVGSF